MSKGVKGKECFNLFIIPILRDKVLQILSIWGFHVSLLSTVTHSNGVSSKIISEGKLFIVLLNSMYLVFWRLRDNLLALIHCVNFVNSELIICTKVWGFLFDKKTLESSAKRINERMSDDLWKSSMALTLRLIKFHRIRWLNHVLLVLLLNRLFCFIIGYLD